MVVQRGTSGWGEAIALENSSNVSRSHCWVGVFAKCLLWATRCHCATILCAPSRGQESRILLPSQKQLLCCISPGSLLFSPLLCKFCPILSFWPLIYSKSYHFSSPTAMQNAPGSRLRPLLFVSMVKEHHCFSCCYHLQERIHSTSSERGSQFLVVGPQKGS